MTDNGIFVCECIILTTLGIIVLCVVTGFIVWAMNRFWFSDEGSWLTTASAEHLRRKTDTLTSPVKLSTNPAKRNPFVDKKYAEKYAKCINVRNPDERRGNMTVEEVIAIASRLKPNFTSVKYHVLAPETMRWSITYTSTASFLRGGKWYGSTIEEALRNAGWRL